jgi:glycerol-3-phosphate dehydrogenase (NAD(P)+)
MNDGEHRRRIGVLGAGSWGTTLANLLAREGHEVRVWSYEADLVERINATGENDRYLPGIRLSDGLRACAGIGETVAGADVVVSVSPSQHVRRVMTEAAATMRPDALVVSASKGIETRTLATMAEVLAEVLPGPAARRVCFLSGPSFALEVAQGQPTAVAVASASHAAAEEAQALFQTPVFRVYTNPDVRGIELAGALKNVIAVGAGMATGLGLGHNTLSALITRGLAEISRLGVALGADPLTFSGLAGMGDLILTCTGGLSRNRHVGEELGRGRPLEAILGEMAMVAEGVETTRAAHALAERTGVEMPITAEVHRVLFEGVHPRDAVENLMTRDPKPELWR